MERLKILVPVDASENSARTLATLIAQRQRVLGRLVLLHVLDTDRLAWRMIPDFQVEMVQENARKAGEALLAEKRQQLAAAGLECELRLETGTPRSLICDIANTENFDLLVIARHSHGEIRDVLFGSVSNHVLHKVRCPVLLL